MCWNAFQRLLNKSIQDVINFAKKIPGFTNLDQEDQISLIKGGCFEVRKICSTSNLLSMFKIKTVERRSGWRVRLVIIESGLVKSETKLVTVPLVTISKSLTLVYSTGWYQEQMLM